jgi:hypothetical protein
MNCNYPKGLLFVFSIILIPLFFMACSTTGGSVNVEYGKNSGYGHSPAVKKGPPPHAPAHGYRAKYRYRYYPDCSVYFDTGRNIYFYLQGDHWRVSVSLPNNLRVKLGSYVALEMSAAKPYVHHNEHKRKYPPGQLKPKKAKKWVKTKKH